MSCFLKEVLFEPVWVVVRIDDASKEDSSGRKDWGVETDRTEVVTDCTVDSWLTCEVSGYSTVEW